MKFIRREEIQWNIVKKNFGRPWVLLGWPIVMFYSKWGVKKTDPIFGKGNPDDPTPTLRVRLPWVDKECTNPELRASLTLKYFGVAWFWRES